MAMLLTGSGRLDEAEPYLQKAVKAAGTPESELTMADYDIRLRKADQARSILESPSASDQVFVAAGLRFAVLDYATGQKDAAHKRVDALLRKPRRLRTSWW